MQLTAYFRQLSLPPLPPIVTLSSNCQMLPFDKKRYRVKFCPCGQNNKDGKFVPFVGHEHHGYCHACGETFNPDRISQVNERVVSIPPKPISYTADMLVRRSMSHYDSNGLTKYLVSKFGHKSTQALISKYKIGTSRFNNGSAVFWQIDEEALVRGGKIIAYDHATGKRIKRNGSGLQTWVHARMKQEDYNLSQCYYGQHLLTDITKPIALFESEKTCIIASMFLPEFICIASGGKGNFKLHRSACLRNRTVVVYPDANAYDEWSATALEISDFYPDSRITVSQLLQSIATEEDIKNGVDVADFFFDIR